ncbi:type VI secretion system-associated FHA domain protein TagH [Paraburkholderia madseniana]|uniref:type VI secretion system-associated FHA domain protein TagH n=1 Tax=Paraburkholderia madseniana TaxID=2599607 RepID=UPI0015C5563A|nr:type VI secretion system-associated FHA domain protein TagH [Paraburkholderia madseniana]NPT68937.1 type VI secretion system-associated FHA domain protein TagH [Paraburkholderia madseniana]
MQLTVIEHAGLPIQRGTTAVFRPPGGTIGRNVDNHLVLPDETRQISRLQALLQIDGDRCVLKNLSSVSVVEVNSTPLSCADEHTLKAGDAIRIGTYLLRAERDNVNVGTDEAPASESRDDFWHTLESRFGGGTHPGAQPGARERTSPSASRGGSDAVQRAVAFDELRNVPSDPLELFGPADSTGDALFEPSPSNLAQPAAPLPPAAPDSRDRKYGVRSTASDHAGEWTQTIRARPLVPGTPDTVRAVEQPARSDGGPAAPHLDVAAQPLLMAFMRGAGLDTASDQWTTDQLCTAGQLLALFANGTVKLLSSRSILKREVKADMTMLLDRENNPLKLLPDGGAVLRQMFGLPFPGFMSPQGAVSDAFNDLHAHQIGMVAGMRAALTELLRRFAPERLEQRTPVQQWLDRYVPMRRKARLWDEYVKLHRDTLLAVEDDFSAVFGSAFLAAYDAEVTQYRNSCRG